MSSQLFPILLTSFHLCFWPLSTFFQIDWSLLKSSLLFSPGPHPPRTHNRQIIEIFSFSLLRCLSFTYRICCAQQVFLHSEMFKRRSFCTGKLFRTEAFTQRSFYTQQAFTQGSFYTEKLVHREAFPQRSFYTEKFWHGEALHRGAFTQRSFYTEKLLYREAFTERSLYTQKLSRRKTLQRSFCTDIAL